MKNLLILIVLLAFLVGCASKDPEVGPAQVGNLELSQKYDDYAEINRLEELDQITSFRFDGWRSLDNDHLIIKTSVTKHYLVTLKNYCHDLRWSNGITVHQDGSQLRSGFDYISPAKTPSQRCYIRSIHRLTPEQSDEMAQIGKNAS